MTTQRQSAQANRNGGSTADAAAQQPLAKLPLVERVERALVLLACLIELDGDIHIPMYEKFEAELQELKRREGVKDRARQLLASYHKPAELMLANQLSPGRSNHAGVAGSSIQVEEGATK